MLGNDHTRLHDEHDAPPSYYDIMETAVRELLIEHGLIRAEEIRRQIEVLDSRSPALGAQVIARAWVDPDFKQRLLENGRQACEDFGITSYDETELIVLENTETVHNLIVCTLCSCYPRPILGLPPDWYKQKPYRARAVYEPRKVLAEIGTENFTEAQLAALVTRDAMIGVVPATAPEAGGLS
jgi:nitrile hydratase